MKTKLILFFLAICSITSAQWQKVFSYPYTGNGSCIAAKDSTIFVGANYGLYQSYDNGNTWSKSVSLPYYNMYALAIKDSNIFAAGDGEGIFLSTDNGATWKSIDSGIYTNHPSELDTVVGNILVSGENIYAGTGSSDYGLGGNGVYVSHNNGTNWTAVSNGLPLHANVQALAVNGTTLYAAVDNNGSGIYNTMDTGMSWVAICPPYSYYPNAIAVIDTNIFAASWGYGMVYSHNNGANWAAINNGLPSNILSSCSIWALTTIGTTIIAGTDSGVYISSNYGTTWEAFNNGLGSYREVTAFGKNGTTLYASVEGYLYKIETSEILGIDELSISNNCILVYPNPTSGIATIQISNNEQARPAEPFGRGIINIEVYNVFGQLVYSQFNIQNPIFKIDLRSKSNGVYFYKISDETGKIIKADKIVVER